MKIYEQLKNWPSKRKAMKIITKRKSEMWVSNNRVLVGGSKKITGRNPNFDTDETKLLISIWGDPKIQKTLITTHKKHAVIAKLAEKMREYGYHRSAEEINTRIKNLKCFYNRIKKDHEIGINSIDPTWKHFNAMDEIMTRPIFSVRPNEIPKPSLRYKLEEARREREERQAENDEDGNGNGTGSSTLNNNNNINIEVDSDDDDDDNNNNCGGGGSGGIGGNGNGSGSLTHETNSQFHNDDADDEMADCVEEKPKLKELDKLIIDDVCKNNNSNSSSDVEDTTINIKDEPIEVDDDTDVIPDKEKDDDEADMFPLSEYFKLTSNNNNTMKNNKIITTIATSLSKDTNPIITSTQGQLKLSQPTTLVLNNNSKPSAVVAQSPQGKISLVPTNFLMKPSTHTQQLQLQQQQQQPQAQHIQIRQTKQHPSHSQHRIIYAPSSNQTNTGMVNNGPMKVLLVNTLQKGSQQGSITSSASTSTVVQQKPIDMHNKTIFTTTSSSAAIQQAAVNQQRMQSTTTVNLSNMVSSANVEKINLIGSSTKSSPTGYRALLGQLIKVQAEGNEVNRQRLQMERERFKFEQSMADKFFGMIPNFTTMISNFMHQQQTQQSQLPKEPEPQTKIPELSSVTQKTDNSCSTKNNRPKSVEEKSSANANKDQSLSEESVTLEFLIPKTEKYD